MLKVVKQALFYAFLFVADVYAQSFDVMKEAPAGAPVEVYGRANLGDGKSDSVLIEQQGEENPLGNPIVSLPQEPQTGNIQAQPSLFNFSNRIATVQENLPQNPKISPQETPQIVNKQIQNTLYESGGRIYDIQSYPAADIDYIEQPNLDKTITTYPAY